MDHKVSTTGILVVRWFDNREVTIASNYYSANPSHEVRRWDKKNKVYVQLPCPALIRAYNTGMGGVDRCDQLLSFYRIKTKSVKWYKRLLYHFTDLALVNAFLLRRAVKGPIPLHRFKLNVAQALMYNVEPGTAPLSRTMLQYQPQMGQQVGQHGDPVAAPAPIDAVRLDRLDHFPENVATRGRFCKVAQCKQRSTFWCNKCKVYLCIKKEKNCFLTYHTVE